MSMALQGVYFGPEREGEWHAWRAKRIGGSDAPAVCGASRYRSRYRAWLDKIQESKPEPMNEAMRWGKRLEPVIIGAYEERMEVKVDERQGCFVHPSREWMGCTIDGRTPDGRLVEVKVAGSGTSRHLGEDGDTDSLPTEWLLQVQHQLAVTGAEWCDVAAFLAQLELRIYPVRRDDTLIDSLVETEEEFWQMVVRKEPPPPESIRDYLDWTVRTGATGSYITISNGRALADADAYVAAGEQLRALEDAKQEAKERLIRHLEGHEYGQLSDGRLLRAQTINIKERVQTVKAHTQLRVSIKECRL
jgi:putative phage-type endonuclease